MPGFARANAPPLPAARPKGGQLDTVPARLRRAGLETAVMRAYDPHLSPGPSGRTSSGGPICRPSTGVHLAPGRAGQEGTAMKVYEAAAIRNVAVVGHGGCGKTQLVSAALLAAGAVNRLGLVDD